MPLSLCSLTKIKSHGSNSTSTHLRSEARLVPVCQNDSIGLEFDVILWWVYLLRLQEQSQGVIPTLILVTHHMTLT